MVFLVDNEEVIGYDRFVLDRFEFESGSVLENVVVEYLAKGTPEYDLTIPETLLNFVTRLIIQ